MREINLTKGYKAIVDDNDFKTLDKFKWLIRIVRGRKYACRLHYYSNERRKWLMMHRVILHVEPNIMVVHRNDNTLDNRKENLTIGSRSHCRSFLSKSRSNKNGYRGVSPREHGKWRAIITVDKKEMRLGDFDYIQDAAKAYNDAAIKYFGEFAVLNEIK